MPGKDGSGPFGMGPVAGEAGVRGQLGGPVVVPMRYCFCPKCGEKASHTTGVSCNSLKCPQFGSSLIRGSEL